MKERFRVKTTEKMATGERKKVGTLSINVGRSLQVIRRDGREVFNGRKSQDRGRKKVKDSSKT